MAHEIAPQPDNAASLTGRTAMVLTASDRCFAGTQTDLSGPAVAALLTDAGANVIDILVLPDELALLTETLRTAAPHVALIATTGGTGLAARDITPEATLAVCDRLVPGLAELIRQDGARHTPYAALGRGVCGVAGATLILNLPGSPAGAISSLRAVLPLLPHALDLLAGNATHAEASSASGEPQNGLAQDPANGRVDEPTERASS
jgi:molybdopterin adenylyltransferase